LAYRAVGHKADLVPSVHPECYFPADQRGRWLLFESERHEQVVVRPGHVTFSQLGTFICKSKHWRKDQYKTLSVYSNGWSVFTAQRSYARVVLGVVILSVCLFVRLSDTCVLGDKTKQCTAYILIPHERAITLVFLTPLLAGG